MKRIFQLCLEGYDPTQIARLLEKDKILKPSAYWEQRDGKLHKSEKIYNWNGDSISYILERKEYLGHMVNFKPQRNPTKPSIKYGIPKKIGLSLKIPTNRSLTLIFGKGYRNFARINAALQEQVENLTAEVTETGEQYDNLERFISKVHKYLDLQALTPAILNDLAKRVYVHVTQVIDGKRTQEIDICYDLVGILPKALFQKNEEAA